MEALCLPKFLFFFIFCLNKKKWSCKELAKKKWYSKLTTLFSKPNNSNHTNSRTTRLSPNRLINRSTSRTTTHYPNRTVNRRTSHTTVRTPTRTINRTNSRTTVRPPPRTTNRTKPRSNHKKHNHAKSSSKSVHRPYPTRNSAARKKTYNLNRLKPKGAILYKEDFKCIFCFQLPTLPADQKRGIIICPHCRHPAHADEFKNWFKSSRLCSRCDRPISINFIQHIEIIPTVVYLRAMKVIMKKRR
jgi:hypothetical protein